MKPIFAFFLWDWMESLVKVLFDFLSFLWNIIYTLGCIELDAFLSVVAAIMDSTGVMTVFQSAMTDLSFYFGVLNAWFPLDLAFTLIGAYFSFLVLFVTVKFILKLIPFIG
jgi:hypothetical protein